METDNKDPQQTITLEEAVRLMINGVVNPDGSVNEEEAMRVCIASRNPTTRYHLALREIVEHVDNWIETVCATPVGVILTSYACATMFAMISAGPDDLDRSDLENTAVAVQAAVAHACDMSQVTLRTVVSLVELTSRTCDYVAAPNGAGSFAVSLVEAARACSLMMDRAMDVIPGLVVAAGPFRGESLPDPATITQTQFISSVLGYLISQAKWVASGVNAVTAASALAQRLGINASGARREAADGKVACDCPQCSPIQRDECPRPEDMARLASMAAVTVQDVMASLDGRNTLYEAMVLAYKLGAPAPRVMVDIIKGTAAPESGVVIHNLTDSKLLDVEALQDPKHPDYDTAMQRWLRVTYGLAGFRLPSDHDTVVS